MRSTIPFLVVLCTASLPAGVLAAEPGVAEIPTASPPEPAAASSAADAGLLLPSTLAPRIHSGTAFANARSGYDGAHAAFVARAVAEGSVLDRFALRVEFEHGPAMGPEDRVRIGARLPVLSQQAHGIDAGVALFYDPKDFREEGNIVGALLVGKDFGRLGLYANALFGSDPEGDDQQLELRLAGLYRAAPDLHLGLDARARYNLSSDEKRAGTLTVDWELQALPTVSLELGHFALVADAGLSALQTRGPYGQPDERTDVAVGVLAMGGVAGAF